MSIADDLEVGVDAILVQPWSTRQGEKVPNTDSVDLAGGAVELDAVFLYSDLADSTLLAWNYDRRVAAKVMKSFLFAASTIIRSEDGVITSFDGDRVMAVFVGDGKNSAAATAALKIKWAVDKVVKPKAEGRFKSLVDAGFVVSHATGIDAGTVLAVRAGVRGANDLIWIGRSPGVAAKLSDLRERPFRSFITADVYRRLNKDAKFGSDDREMWQPRPSDLMGLSVYRSSWQWKP